MEIGVVLPHTGPHATRTRIRDVALQAEAAGLDGLWAVDHLVLPDRVASPYVLGRAPSAIADGAIGAQLAPTYELVTTLAWVAGFTERIALGTSILVLPVRNAVANARQLATLDELCGGRLRVGVGAGWLREEVEAVGMPWDRRGARADEHIALLRHLWCASGETVEFRGEFHDIPPMHPDPRPRQRPIPIYVGGHSEAAVRRAGRLGDGWITAPMSPSRVAEGWGRVRVVAEEHGRDPDTLELIASASASPNRSRADLIAEYADIGVMHLQFQLSSDPSRAHDEILELAEHQEVAT
jgi:probable F420-dependent oxidoreductase